MLRRFTIDPAKRLRAAHLAAGQGHSLKGPFIAEFRLEVWLLDGPASVFPKLVLVDVFLGHKLVKPFIRQTGDVRRNPPDFKDRLTPIEAGIVVTCDDLGPLCGGRFAAILRRYVIGG
jgi:hypothetical protein